MSSTNPGCSPPVEAAVVAVRRYIEQVGPGGDLPGAEHLSRRLGLQVPHINRALVALDTLGAIAIRRGSGALVLAPGQQHPDDVELDLLVRGRILSGFYKPGHALPSGLLRHQFRLSDGQFARACRHLVAGALLRQGDTPYGPGFYIAKPAEHRMCVRPASPDRPAVVGSVSSQP